MNEIVEALREFILATYLPGESPDTLDQDTPLVSSGILDSLAVLSVAGFIHDRFGVELEFQETSVEHFDRIRDIAANVLRRRTRVESPVSEGGV